MSAGPGAPILEVRDLAVRFTLERGFFGAPRRVLRAVDGVSLTLHRGETLGLVGESGCGKSTTARAILRILEPAAGTVRLDVGGAAGPPRWLELTRLGRRELRRARRHIQMIFQDPHASLDPRMTVGEIVAEPMRIFRLHSRREIARRVQALLEEVGLDPQFIRRYPHEFSGGQRQRIGIARALALDPDVIVCDEAVSALDVSIRSQVVNLLMELQSRRGLSYIFIAHDLSVVKHISHRIAVMYLGKVVEEARYDRIYREPRHPYTEALLSAIPIPDPEVEARRRRILLGGELPDPAGTQAGCAFASRCHRVVDRCRVTLPDLIAVAPDHRAACILVEPEAAAGGKSA